MKKYLTILSAALFISHTQAHAQMPYRFTAKSETYAQLTGATSLNGTSAWTDSTSYRLPLGFSFKMGGKTLTSLSLFETNTIATDTVGIISGFSFTGTPLIDRGIVSGISKSPIRYTTSGAAGNKIFKLELLNAGLSDENDIYSTLADSINVQVWLYEDSNAIELHYGSSKLTHTGDYFFSGGPMLGYIKNANDTTGNFDMFYVLKGNPLAPTVDSFTASSTTFPSLSAYPASGTVYRFVPKNTAGTGIAGIMQIDGVKIYPTVCTDKLFVENAHSNLQYHIVSISGSTLQNGTMASGRNSIDVSTMPAGMYILSVKNDVGAGVYKFIKQ